ncbi:RHS repeat-associated core domain-containing protein [Mycobacterium camsae]|uniref:RHS repeat-associated core domain-containing protein n=1 Tax=Mycobacterium gordonae TaxID=1778 RepID=UPI001F11D1FF|nr:RHS repeat-associated core domain-containing protein [Mycobacterium gordonae]
MSWSQPDVDRAFYALVTDHLGTPTHVVDPASARVAGRASSGLWGQTTWTGEVSTPLRFPGQYFDGETGWHYNRHRYYHPATGRYCTADPLRLAPAPNPYGYPRNPTVETDPLGLMACPGEETPGSSSARSGTIWDHIKPTQPNYPGTPIPRSFELSTPNGDVWVHPNVTDHLHEVLGSYVERGIPHERSSPGGRDFLRHELFDIRIQADLSNLRRAVGHALEQGIAYDDVMVIDNWSTTFGPPRGEGLLPTLFHGNFW